MHEDRRVNQHYKKVIVPTNPSDWHGMEAERLWACEVAPGEYRVENVPMYAYGISWGDTISATDLASGDAQFSSVTREGGHSTYRVLLRKGKTVEDFAARWVALEKLGCSYESSKEPEDTFAIDVPPDVDVDAVFALLDQGEVEGTWYMDEGNFEHSRRG
jgi:hypothetical protein